MHLTDGTCVSPPHHYCVLYAATMRCNCPKTSRGCIERRGGVFGKPGTGTRGTERQGTVYSRSRLGAVDLYIHAGYPKEQYTCLREGIVNYTPQTDKLHIMGVRVHTLAHTIWSSRIPAFEPLTNTHLRLLLSIFRTKSFSIVAVKTVDRAVHSIPVQLRRACSRKPHQCTYRSRF